MSDQQTQTPEQTAPSPVDVAEAANKGKSDETPEQTIEALRAALAKANAEAKDNRIKATELDKLKQEQMSDLERAQARAKELEDQATKATSEALRWRIAAKHGISDEDAETFLTGNDEATLTRQAERLSALATAAPTTPKPDLSQGGSAGTPRPQTAAEKFAAAFEGRV